jgi:hypothetical protein
MICLVFLFSGAVHSPHRTTPHNKQALAQVKPNWLGKGKWEDFPYMANFHIWEDLPYMRSLPMYGTTSHIWEDFPTSRYGKSSLYGKSSHVYEKSSNAWGVLQYMERHPIYGKTSQVRAAFTYIRRLPIYGKTCHIWQAPGFA